MSSLRIGGLVEIKSGLLWIMTDVLWDAVRGVEAVDPIMKRQIEWEKKQDSWRTPVAKDTWKEGNRRPGLEESLYNGSDTESPTTVKCDHRTKKTRQRSRSSVSPAHSAFSMPCSLYKSSERGSRSERVHTDPRKGQRSALSARTNSRKGHSPVDITAVTSPDTWTVTGRLSDGGAKSSLKSKGTLSCALTPKTSVRGSSTNKKSVKSPFSHSLASLFSTKDMDQDVSPEHSPSAEANTQELDRWELPGETSPPLDQPSTSWGLDIATPVPGVNRNGEKLKHTQIEEGKENKGRRKSGNVRKRRLSDGSSQTPQPPKKVTKAQSTSRTETSIDALPLALSEDEDVLEGEGRKVGVMQPVTGISSLLQGFNLDMKKQMKVRENQVQQFAEGALNLSDRRISNLWTTWRAKRGEALSSFKDHVHSDLCDLEQDMAMWTDREKTVEATYLKQLNVLHEHREKLQNRVKCMMECHEDFRVETEQLEDQSYVAQRGLKVLMKQDMDQLKTRLLLDMQQQQLKRVKDSLQKHFV